MLPIYIGACGRSGTTMLADLLARRGDVVMPPEAQFVFEGLAARGRGADFAQAVRASWRLRLWGLSERELDAAELAGRPPREVMTRLVRAYAAKHGRPEARFWVDHTPANVMHARTVLELFPESRLVHLVRDPRAVAASVLPLDWGPATAREAASWWLSRIAAGLAAESVYPDRVHRLRYEDVVLDPEATMARLATQLGLPADVPTDATTRAMTDYTRAQHRLVGAAPDPGRITAWQSALRPREVEIVEAEVGDTLALLRYDPVTAATRPPVTAGETLHGLWRKADMRVHRTARRRRVNRG